MTAAIGTDKINASNNTAHGKKLIDNTATPQQMATEHWQGNAKLDPNRKVYPLPILGELSICRHVSRLKHEKQQNCPPGHHFQPAGIRHNL